MPRAVRGTVPSLTERKPLQMSAFRSASARPRCVSPAKIPACEIRLRAELPAGELRRDMEKSKAAAEPANRGATRSDRPTASRPARPIATPPMRSC
jgi:hypothetical protein